MKKITIAICEQQDAYRERLAEFLIQKKGDRMQVFTFSDKTRFEQKRKGRDYDIVHFSREFAKSLPEEEPDSLYIFLSETPDWTKEQEPAVFKYQSAEEILRSIFAYYLKLEKDNPYISKKEKEIIGIYSPTQSKLRTPFALTLAEMLAQNKKSLYVNLGEWAGLGNWFQEKFHRDLADLLYLLSDYGGQVQGVLESVIRTLDKVDYIPPMTDAQLLSQTGAEDYLALLKFLVEKTDYDIIFLDFGIMVPGFFELLEQCTSIYAIADPGVMARGQFQQFEESLIKGGKAHMEEKMKYISFSEDEEQQLMQLDPEVHQWLYSILGDRARAARYL